MTQAICVRNGFLTTNMLKDVCIVFAKKCMYKTLIPIPPLKAKSKIKVEKNDTKGVKSTN